LRIPAASAPRWIGPPQYDDLETIAAHALAWEEKLLRERGGEGQHAQSA